VVATPSSRSSSCSQLAQTEQQLDESRQQLQQAQQAVAEAQQAADEARQAAEQTSQQPAAAADDSGLAELTLSQLGVQRATDPQLKEFSQRMLEEHTRMNQELMTLSSQKGMRIPQMVDVRSQFCAQNLAGLSGEKFDKCYAKAQLIAHMDAVGMFEAEAERGIDPDMRALAAKALPHIKDHLNQIKPIARKYMKDSEPGAERGGIGVAAGQPIR